MTGWLLESGLLAGAGTKLWHQSGPWGLELPTPASNVFWIPLSQVLHNDHLILPAGIKLEGLGSHAAWHNELKQHYSVSNKHILYRTFENTIPNSWTGTGTWRGSLVLQRIVLNWECVKNECTHVGHTVTYNKCWLLLHRKPGRCDYSHHLFFKESKAQTREVFNTTEIAPLYCILCTQRSWNKRLPAGALLMHDSIFSLLLHIF